ncbi:hypothetical protein Tco_0006755 [Tanacetum coccineum]
MKCSPGKKFLRGWWRQELLSRLLPHVTDECKTQLTQFRPLYDSEPTDKQASSSVSGVVESPDGEASVVYKDMPNHVDPVASGIVDDKRVLSVNEQPVRKLKLVIKQKPKHHHFSKTTNDNAGGEAEFMEDPRPKKKRKSIDINLNNPQVCPLSDGDKSVSTRNRPWTIKALEVLANGLLDPKSKRKGPEDKTPRRFRAKTALVTVEKVAPKWVSGVALVDLIFAMVFGRLKEKKPRNVSFKDIIRIDAVRLNKEMMAETRDNKNCVISAISMATAAGVVCSSSTADITNVASSDPKGGTTGSRNRRDYE